MGVDRLGCQPPSRKGCAPNRGAGDCQCAGSDREANQRRRISADAGNANGPSDHRGDPGRNTGDSPVDRQWRAYISRFGDVCRESGFAGTSWRSRVNWPCRDGSGTGRMGSSSSLPPATQLLSPNSKQRLLPALVAHESRRFGSLPRLRLARSRLHSRSFDRTLGAHY